MSTCGSYGCLGRAQRPLQSALDTTGTANSTAAASCLLRCALRPCGHQQQREPRAAGAVVVSWAVSVARRWPPRARAERCNPGRRAAASGSANA